MLGWVVITFLGASLVWSIVALYRVGWDCFDWEWDFDVDLEWMGGEPPCAGGGMGPAAL